jgi:hypothetical protein
MPSLYREILQLPTIKTFPLPTPPELREFSTPLIVNDDIRAIEEKWEKEHGVEVEGGWVRMRTFGEYTFQTVQRFVDAEQSVQQQDQEEEPDSQDESDNDKKLAGNQKPRQIQFQTDRNDESSLSTINL